MRILLVNFDVESAALMISDLDDHGYSVRCVPDASAFCAAPPANPPDVVLGCLDESPAGVLDAIARIGELKGFKAIPVLFTGHDGSGLEQAGERFPRASFARRDALLNALASMNA